MKRTNKFFLLILTSYYLYSCANISSPTGGPKDTQPPKLIKEKTSPLPNTLNFKGNTIELTFDEDVTAQNIQEQLIITPLEDNPYKVIQRRNKIRLVFEKNFSPNTTYTFNFREGIKDLTEGNSSENLIIPFSTGSFIDSIYVSGKVTELKTNKAEVNILVSLYNSTDTLSPLNSKPIYFSKTNKNGEYKIQNIKSGNYDLFAIEDKNKNLKYEEAERIAFLKNIPLDSSKNNVELKTSLFDTQPPYIKNTTSTHYTYEIRFNEGLKNIEIESPQLKEYIYTIGKGGKSIFINTPSENNDSIPINIQAVDSSGNELKKEIKIFFDKETIRKKEAINMEYFPKDRNLKPQKAEIEILFNWPPTKSFIDKIKIQEDTNANMISLNQENIKWKNNKTLQITKNTKAKEKVELIIPEESFFLFDTANSADTINFEFKKEENYASLSGRIKTEKKDYILELLDEKYNVVEKTNNTSIFKFTYIEPGSYYLRVINDENKNGIWDQGNIKENKQPEPIYIYKNKIELRANWEIQDIIVEF